MAKKTTATTPADIARVESAFSISSECQEIVQAIIDNGGECDDATLERLQAWQGAMEHKAQNIALVKTRLETEAAYFKQLEEAAHSRRKAREGAAEKLKKYLAICMKSADMKSIKSNDGLFSVSLVAGRASVRVDDPGKLPMELCDVVEVLRPKTDEIKKRLENGESVSGASLEYGADYVMIRS